MMILTGFLICGCGKARERGNKVIARINNYTMTDEDFRDAMSRTLGSTKEAILDELITKNILVQEAQRENFDKDKAFMKEIESYWEQALLKLLIKKKMAEFSADFKGDTNKVVSAMDIWVKKLRSGAKVKIYKENLDAIKVP